MEFYKYKLMLWKSYVDRGRGLTSYFNELFLLFGFYSISEKKSFLYLIGIIGIYVLFCLVLGWAYFYFGWQNAENEVQNQYNEFQKGVRKSLNIEVPIEKRE